MARIECKETFSFPEVELPTVQPVKKELTTLVNKSQEIVNSRLVSPEKRIYMRFPTDLMHNGHGSGQVSNTYITLNTSTSYNKFIYQLLSSIAIQLFLRAISTTPYFYSSET